MDDLLLKNASHTSPLLDAKAPLWVAALDDQDPWFKFFNWQTQFELTRFLQRQSGNKTIPVLYFCNQYLPTKMILLIKNEVSETWAQTILENWQKLGGVKMRIFLPANINRAEFEKYWQTPVDLVSFVESEP